MGEAAERAGQTGREPRAGTQTGSGLQGRANHQTQHCGEGLFQLNPLPIFPLGWHRRKQQLLPEIPAQGDARCRALCDNTACCDLPGGGVVFRVPGYGSESVGLWWGLRVKNILLLTPLAPPAGGCRSTAVFFPRIKQFGFVQAMAGRNYAPVLDLNVIPPEFPSLLSEYEEKGRSNGEYQTASCGSRGPELAPTTSRRKIFRSGLPFRRAAVFALHNCPAPGHPHHRSVVTQRPLKLFRFSFIRQSWENRGGIWE